MVASCDGGGPGAGREEAGVEADGAEGAQIDVSSTGHGLPEENGEPEFQGAADAARGGGRGIDGTTAVLEKVGGDAGGDGPEEEAAVAIEPEPVAGTVVVDEAERLAATIRGNGNSIWAQPRLRPMKPGASG